MNLTSDLPSNHSIGWPTWSPDGTRIAFSVDAPGVAGYTSSIWTMNADGSDKRVVASALNPGDRNPTWSPDGARIAFTRVYGQDTDITIVNLSDGSTTRITARGTIRASPTR